jgi:hypothetical protein
VRPPCLEVGPADLGILGDARFVLAVIECERDEVREWLVDNDQDSRGTQKLILLDLPILAAR